MSAMENILLGILVILLLFWMRPGIKATMARSKQTPTDWQSVVLPIGLVVMFVLFLIAMV
jgi:hypothetical protein